MQHARLPPPVMSILPHDNVIQGVKAPQPKTSSKNHRKGTQKMQETRAVESNSQASVMCAICEESYDMGLSTDDWIQCLGCENWYELVCAGMAGKPKTVQEKFKCQECILNLLQTDS